MDLTSLVTEQLPPEQGNPSPEEIISGRRRISPEQMIEIIARARGKSGRDLWQEMTIIAAYQTTSNIFHSRDFNALILIKTHEAALGSEEALEWIRDKLLFLESEAKAIVGRVHRENAIGSFDKSIDFLREIFEDDTASFLKDVTGVSLATARRWIGGGGASRQNAFTVYSVASGLFYYYQKHGREQTKAWLRSLLPSGRRVRDSWAGFHKRIDPALRLELKSVGLL